MSQAKPVPAAAVTVGLGDIALSCHAQTFLFPPGHRLRAGHCLICQELIGGQTAAVLYAISFDQGACDCGSIELDAFIIHAAHLPLTDRQLQAAIRLGLYCANSIHTGSPT